MWPTCTRSVGTPVSSFVLLVGSFWTVQVAFWAGWWFFEVGSGKVTPITDPVRKPALWALQPWYWLGQLQGCDL